MLKAFFLFCNLFPCCLVFAQVPFEGKVTYKLTNKNEDENRSGTVEVLYGKQMIKGVLKNSDLQTSDDRILIVDFLKGIFYNISDSAKSYSADSLKAGGINNMLARYKKTGIKQNILGQSCSAFSYIDTTKRNDFIGQMDFLFWYADSLYFPVSESYLGSDETVMFTNGKTIGMGMAMKMDVFEKKTFVNLQPVHIEAIALADSLFDLPKGYTFKKANLQEDQKIEIKLGEVKTDDVPPPPPPPPTPVRVIPKKKKNGKS